MLELANGQSKSGNEETPAEDRKTTSRQRRLGDEKDAVCGLWKKDGEEGGSRRVVGVSRESRGCAALISQFRASGVRCCGKPWLHFTRAYNLNDNNYSPHLDKPPM